MKTIPVVLSCCLTLWCNTGCRQNVDMRKKAWVHSQEVVSYLYSDSIYSYLPDNRFPHRAVDNMLEKLRAYCPSEKQQGGYKGYKYQWNLGKKDGVSFHYVYKCGTNEAEVQVHYFITKDTFEIAGLKVFYPDPHKGLSAK